MKKPSNYLIRFLGALLLVANFQVYAVPTLYFDGDTNYDAITGLLTINAVLTGSVDIAPPPGLDGSSMTLSTSFGSVSSAGGTTTGFFGSAPGAPDLSIIDGNAVTLLEGEIMDLILRGEDGRDSGILAANFSPTAGSLLGDFADPSGIFALELNLTSVFGPGIFDEDFSGQADGRVTPGEAFPPSLIPEPDLLVLLAMSLLGLLAGQMYLKRTKNY